MRFSPFRSFMYASICVWGSKHTIYGRGHDGLKAGRGREKGGGSSVIFLQQRNDEVYSLLMQSQDTVQYSKYSTLQENKN